MESPAPAPLEDPAIQAFCFSCIIVNYQAGDYLRRCLSSLFAHVGREDFEVVVVDNGSTDGSVGLAKELGFNIRWIELKENIGFARANNLAASVARGEFLILLNPDTEITRDCITPLIEYLRRHPDVGIIGGHHRDRNGCWQRSFDLLPTLAREFLYALAPRRYWEALPSRSPASPVEVGWLYGSFLVIRRSLVQEIGLFDETFFLNDEDLELASRVRRRNLRIVYHPGDGLVHYGGVSKSKLPSAGREYVASRRLYYRKQSGRWAEKVYLVAAFLRRLREEISAAKRE